MKLKYKPIKYSKTTNFIYELAAKRIRTKKEDSKLTNFEIAGYKSEDEYSRLNASVKTTYYNPDVVKRMTSGNILNKRFEYFLTQKYARLFQQMLGFNELHEVYWGKKEDIQGYSEDLFYCLVEDMKQDNATKNNINILLEIKSKKEIYDSIKDEFFRLYYQFTKGKYDETGINIVGVNSSKALSQLNNPLKFTDENTLTFKKLDTNIKLFAQEDLRKLLIAKYISFVAESIS